MTERKDIAARLENWAQWAGSAPARRGHDSITGAICEGLRKAALGELHGGEAIIRNIDANDALVIARSMVKITLDQRRILGRHYFDRQRPGYIAALMRFPPDEYDSRLLAAQRAIEQAADSNK